MPCPRTATSPIAHPGYCAHYQRHRPLAPKRSFASSPPPPPSPLYHTYTCGPMLRHSFLAWLAVASCAHAAVRNVTVDDSGKDELTGNEITYYPTGAWNDASDCDGCTAHPAETNLVGGTWHDSTFNKQPGSNDFPNEPLYASFQFTGTAVYVFCVLARSSSSPTGNSDMTFWIDDNIAGTFAKIAPGEAGYDYNMSVFSHDSLENGRHNLTIQNGHVDGVKSLILLDYIVYTYDDDTSSGSSNSTSSDGDTANQSASSDSTSTDHTTVIVAVVVPVVCVLALIGVGVFFWRKRKQEADKPPMRLASPEPFTDPAWAGNAPASQAQYAQPSPGQQYPTQAGYTPQGQAQAPYGAYANQYSPTDAASSYYPPAVVGGVMTYPPSSSSHPSQAHPPQSEADSAWSASGLYRNPSQAALSQAGSQAMSSGSGSASGSATQAYGSQVGYLPHHGKQIEVGSAVSGTDSMTHRTQPSTEAMGASGSAGPVHQSHEQAAEHADLDAPPPAYEDDASGSTSAAAIQARRNADRKR
ncbi:uncharacterized protein SCHCODRAFT_02609508 [Schizophyllum commune H4-8]|nr:uncharacterized protein SCHCODRAFT_02609508 [Schizophyllum commune H4-8]KAI5897510.1 hypothetical protein SCHCODRAFT_02609508 [Schizophyllum commune H4-8]